MSLQSEIDEMKQQSAAKASQQVRETMMQATLDLKKKNIENDALSAGDMAIDFTLPNAQGKDINLKDELVKGPVVLNIYRGGWCPYCNLELKALKESLSEIEATGAQLIAVAPQLPDKTVDTVEKHQLEIEVLSDVGNKISRQYGLVFTLAESLRAIYDSFGIDIPEYNGDDSFELPVPATYVINKNGEIAYAFVDADYTKRMEPAEIVKILNQL